MSWVIDSIQEHNGILYRRAYSTFNPEIATLHMSYNSIDDFHDDKIQWWGTTLMDLSTASDRRVHDWDLFFNYLDASDLCNACAVGRHWECYGADQGGPGNVAKCARYTANLVDNNQA